MAEPAHSHPHPHPHGPGGHSHRTGVLGVLESVFAPHSHDVGDQIDTALESSALGITAVKISLVGLLVTAFLQLSVVLISGSVALLADTIHNFADAMTAIPLWFAFVIGRRAVTRRYSYGYKRSEDLAGLFVLAMMLGSTILAAWESIDRLINPHEVTYLGLVALAGLIGFLGNEGVAVYRIRIGNRIGSAALIADGYHARTDGLTSLAVVLGAAGVWLGFPLADPIIGILISISILVVLKSAIVQVFGRLMDAVDPAIVDQVEAVARSVDGVMDVNSVRVRWVGHRLETTLNATVDCKLTVEAGHAIAESIRHDLYHALRKLDAANVHIDPCDHEGVDNHFATRKHDAKKQALAIAS